MIEIRRDELDARARETWQKALAAHPLVARPTERLDGRIAIFFALLWLAAYAATFGAWSIDPSPWALALVRALAGGGCLYFVGGALRAHDARERAWSDGASLFTWGWAEIVDDVMWVVPFEELDLWLEDHVRAGVRVLRIGIDGRRPIALALGADELARVLASMDGASRVLPAAAESYRDTSTAIVGPRVTPGRRWVEAWTPLLVIASIGAIVPPLATPPAAEPDVVPSDPWRAIAAEHVTTDVGSCLGPSTRDSIAAYLALALETPNLGPLHPFAPVRAVAGERGRLWAHCTWRVDPAHGTLASAEIRWGLSPRGGDSRAWSATVASTEILRSLRDCAGAAPEVSPQSLADASMRLLGAIFVDDLVRHVPSLSTQVAAAPSELVCALAYARTIPIVAIAPAPSL